LTATEGELRAHCMLRDRRLELEKVAAPEHVKRRHPLHVGLLHLNVVVHHVVDKISVAYNTRSKFLGYCVYHQPFNIEC